MNGLERTSWKLRSDRLMKDNVKRGMALLIVLLLAMGALPGRAAAEERVVALSKSNAELWILAGGRLAATSDDAMNIPGLNPDAIALGDMDHVSLERIAALEPADPLFGRTRAAGPGGGGKRHRNNGAGAGYQQLFGLCRRDAGPDRPHRPGRFV